MASDKKFCKHCGAEVKAFQVPVNNAPSSSWVGRHKKALIISGIIIALIGITVVFAESSPSSEIHSSADIGASVVNILCTSKSGEESGGSGTILSEDGEILTNAHVIPQVNEVPSISGKGCLVVLPDEDTGQPKEIYVAIPEITKKLSKEYDIATLKIIAAHVDEDGKSWGTFPKTFPSFQGPDCEGEYIKLGDSVRIYGYPVTSGGYSLTVTDGIVSSFNSDGTVLTSAKIDSGNSGGLAVDQYGCFIGIPSAVIEGNFQNLGVIIPPNVISDFVDNVPFQYGYSNASCDDNQCSFNGQCLTPPSNSSCVEDDSSNAWKCNAGYVESGGYCIKPTPRPTPAEKSASQLCQDKYGWNTYSDGTYCQCNNGYVWNAPKTSCVTRTASCQETWANTYWDGTFSTDGKFNCSCNSGYVWNFNQTACVSKSSVDQICREKYGYDSYYLGRVEDGKYMCQ